MRIYRCGIIDYPEGQIYSIDLHPSGKYIATCGNDGKGNGLVTIWNTSLFDIDSSTNKQNNDPLLNTDDSIPLSLASLPPTSSEDISKCKIVEKRLYNNGQNCIRWAKFNEGNWLVSAGDSSVLHLYEPFARLDQGDISLENVTSLTGHTMEILHADFSRDGKFLASCSLDNTIIIWNLDELPKASIVLNAGRGGHTDFVTGIAWDPAEKFLASQSADNTLKIWRCETWECERTVKGCFASSSRSSLYTRLDWSSDGAFLVSACASNSGFQTAKVIIRKGFNYERDLVGFKSLVSCVRSNDHCVLYHDPTFGNMELNLIAIGSLDRSISVWLLPGINRPLCVVRNLFPEGILDLTWHKNTLAVIGINGSVRCIFFDEAEIGKYLNGTEMCNHFDNLYKSIPSSFKTFLPKLNVDGGANWVDQILNNVYLPSERLNGKCSENHRRLGYHQFSPTCQNCCRFYSRTKREFNTDSMETFAHDLHMELRKLSPKELDNQSISSASEMSD